MSRQLNVPAADKIVALKVAREKIRGRWPAYICSALPQSPAGVYLVKYIGSQLQPQLFLDSWIMMRRPGLPTDRKSMHTYRLQWIDWMIAGLEDEKGDTNDQT